MSKATKPLFKFISKFENNIVLLSIRKGFTLAIPFILIGAFSLVLINLPILAYRNFIESALNGAIKELFLFLYHATFGILSIILTLTISYSFGQMLFDKKGANILLPVISLSAFVIMSGVGTESFTIDNFGVYGIFTAIFTALVSVFLFSLFARPKRLSSVKLYAGGTDSEFNLSLSTLFPTVLVLGIFAAVQLLLVHVLGVDSLTALFTKFIITIFSNIENNLLAGLLYVFFISFLWFFGIHGSNVLETVSQQVLGGAIGAIGIIYSSNSEVLSKASIDAFVSMGGVGTTISMVIAILLFSKQNSIRKIAKIGLVPTVFNVNELLLFGLPMVYSPIFLIPFIFTPIVLTLTTYLAMSIGLVPLAVNTVSWTTPVFFSGYLATGSVAGILLQVFNIILGIAIYFPFVKLYESNMLTSLQHDVGELMEQLEEYERAGTQSEFISRRDHLGSIANTLVVDLQHALRNNELELYYQPQVDADGQCIGAEALLRWNHDVAGFIAPPLILALAREGEILDQLELWILLKGCKDAKKLLERFGKGFKVSINITADLLKNPEFLPKLESYIDAYVLPPECIWIEVTEQTALSSTHDVVTCLHTLQEKGHSVVIDDFGMGHTSLMYLQNNHFDMVKLDGGLVRGLPQNKRSGDIISSIVYLSKALNFEVLAEFVENEEQLETLVNLGVPRFQGYLFYKPLPLQELLVIDRTFCSQTEIF